MDSSSHNFTGYRLNSVRIPTEIHLKTVLEVRDAEMFVGLRKMVGEHQDQQRWHGAVEVGNGWDPRSDKAEDIASFTWRFPRIRVSCISAKLFDSCSSGCMPLRWLDNSCESFEKMAGCRGKQCTTLLDWHSRVGLVRGWSSKQQLFKEGTDMKVLRETVLERIWTSFSGTSPEINLVNTKVTKLAYALHVCMKRTYW